QCGDPAKTAHRCLLGRKRILSQQVLFPEPERTMLLERGHVTQRPLVVKVRHAPLHRLHNVGTRLVNYLSNMLKYRLSKVGRLLDIGVDSGVYGRHDDKYTPIS